MSHRHHVICVLAAVGLALWFLVAGNGGVALAGVSLALLICPLVMGVVMWLLMRPPLSERTERHHHEPSAPFSGGQAR